MRGRLDNKISVRGSLGILSLGLVFVFREGFETILFLLPLIYSQPFISIVGIALIIYVYRKSE